MLSVESPWKIYDGSLKANRQAADSCFAQPYQRINMLDWQLIGFPWPGFDLRNWLARAVAVLSIIPVSVPNRALALQEGRVQSSGHDMNSQFGCFAGVEMVLQGGVQVFFHSSLADFHQHRRRDCQRLDDALIKSKKTKAGQKKPRISCAVPPCSLSERFRSPR